MEMEIPITFSDIFNGVGTIIIIIILIYYIYIKKIFQIYKLYKRYQKRYQKKSSSYSVSKNNYHSVYL